MNRRLVVALSLAAVAVLGYFAFLRMAVDIFGEWVPAEVRAEPLYDPLGERIRR